MALMGEAGEGGELLGLRQGEGAAHGVHDELVGAEGREGVRAQLPEHFGLGEEVVLEAVGVELRRSK